MDNKRHEVCHSRASVWLDLWDSPFPSMLIALVVLADPVLALLLGLLTISVAIEYLYIDRS